MSIVEAPVPLYCLSCVALVTVEASSTLGLKSKQSLKSKSVPVVSEV